MAKQHTNQNNPLMRFMRQPKIYISLPSEGKYWKEGSIEIPENGQIPVYSMTAKDEIMFKTPDALMNGQAVVDVLQSCIPDIKNAWACPSIDLDLLLIAIRIATYGDKMIVSYKVPNINEDSEYELDLHTFIDQASQIQWIEQVPIDDEMIVFVKPLTYKHMSTISQRSFETNKIMQIATDQTMTEQQKAVLISDSFKTLTDLTTDMMVGSIFKIKTPDGDVTETRYIKEFIENSDKSFVDTIQSHINDLKSQNEIKPMMLTTTIEQQEQGAPATFEVPINFDNTTFFG
jgi:hypothetical protein